MSYKLRSEAFFQAAPLLLLMTRFVCGRDFKHAGGNQVEIRWKSVKVREVSVRTTINSPSLRHPGWFSRLLTANPPERRLCDLLHLGAPPGSAS